MTNFNSLEIYGIIQIFRPRIIENIRKIVFFYHELHLKIYKGLTMMAIVAMNEWCYINDK